MFLCTVEIKTTTIKWVFHINTKCLYIIDNVRIEEYIFMNHVKTSLKEYICVFMYFLECRCNHSGIFILIFFFNHIKDDGVYFIIIYINTSEIYTGIMY